MIILSIGTNIGDRERNIENAIVALGKIGKVSAVSPIYTSEPWGFESENGFYNIALILESELSPLDLLRETQRIEKELGRTAKTTTEYADRVIDIDIIDYDNQIIRHETRDTRHEMRDTRCETRDTRHEILKINNPSASGITPKTEEEFQEQLSIPNFQLSTLNNSSPVLGEVHEVGRGKTLNFKLSTLNSQRSLLTLPHPLMHLRNFVLYPLADIAPEWRHPILKLTAQELKERSEDKSIPDKKIKNK
ncbi:MAG: 2-amino-4-hydroxy-6-hydroxymethyldihydropteridine diphosphokinase [Paludibacteraceae bacterium]|nr:2-amino-4-hydroxy-6-hydroxymethyldihydropteridine diphosphokinase [Paludibacteraceae bacterium]